MSFLLRRSLAKAIAGWHDYDFTTTGVPNSNPVTFPWGRWNNSQSAQRISNEMVFDGAGSSLFNPGGYAYEHQPFTPFWGCEFEIKASLNNTLQAQMFAMFINYPWSKNQTTLSQTAAIELFHNSPALLGGEFNRVQVKRLEPSSLETVLAEADLPGGNAWWNASLWHAVRVFVNNDKDLRIWIDGNLMVMVRLTPGYEAAAGKRAFNFTNRLYNSTNLRKYRLYDRTNDMVSAWSTIFYDDYNRSNRAVDNGWTVFGAAGQIVGNSYSMTGTTDGGQAILRDTGITNGKLRVEGITGGNLNMSGSDSGLLLCCNAAGTQGLAANVTSGGVWIERFSSALTGNPPTFTTLRSRALTIGNGWKVAFCLDNGTAWVEIDNGSTIINEPIVATDIANTVVPITNRWAGQRVERSSFASSNSWNDCRILVPA